jgi:hypothetical protein
MVMLLLPTPESPTMTILAVSYLRFLPCIVIAMMVIEMMVAICRLAL